MLWVLGGGSAVLGVRGVLPVGLGAAPCMEGGGQGKKFLPPSCRAGVAVPEMTPGMSWVSERGSPRSIPCSGLKASG